MKRLPLCIFIVGIVLVSLAGCKDFLSKKDPTATSFSEFFNDQSDLHRVTYSAYRDVFMNTGDRRLLFYMHTGFSDFGYARLRSDFEKIIASGQYDASSRPFEYYYTLHMKHIGRINTYLSKIDVPYVESDSVRQFYKLQLKSIRLWNYLWLTNKFGAVPFVREPVTLEEALLPRTPKDVILDTLFMAGQRIAKKLPTKKYTTDYYMFNRWSLEALLMRYALYDKRYNLAIKLAKDIMNSGMYELYSDYGALFQYTATHENDEFILWISRAAYDGQTWTYNHLGPPFRTSNGASYIVPTKALVDFYWTKGGYTIENSPKYSKIEYQLNPELYRDPRLDATIITPNEKFYGEPINIYDSNSNLYFRNEQSSATGYWFRKWVSKEDIFGGDGDMEFGRIRYAEVLLTYAEAKIMLGEIDGSVKRAINKIRARAGLDMEKADVTLPRYNSYTQEDWIKLIRRERSIELAGEGVRYADIIRWGIADKVLNQPVRGDTRKVNGEVETIFVHNRQFKPRNYLWPLPANMMKRNTNLTQNPGY